MSSRLLRKVKSNRLRLVLAYLRHSQVNFRRLLVENCRAEMTRNLFWTLAPGLLSFLAFVLISTALFGQHSTWLNGVYFLEVSVDASSVGEVDDN